MEAPPRAVLSPTRGRMLAKRARLQRLGLWLLICQMASPLLAYEQPGYAYAARREAPTSHAPRRAARPNDPRPRPANDVLYDLPDAKSQGVLLRRDDGEPPPPGEPVVDPPPDWLSHEPADEFAPDSPDDLPSDRSERSRRGARHDDDRYDGNRHGFKIEKPILGEMWIDVDSRIGWVEGFHVPALVTTSRANTPRADAGVLGESGTRVLLGNERLADDARFGGRASFGVWLDECKTSAVQASYLLLDQDVSLDHFESPGSPILARPFFNIETAANRQDALLIAFPNVLRGEIDVRSQTRLQAVEVLWRHALFRERCWRLDLVAGWRHDRLEDELTISDFRSSLDVSSGLAVGTTLSQVDQFESRNLFHGEELGVVAELRRCRWSVESTMKVALGNNHARVAIDGSNRVTVPVQGQPSDVSVSPAGFLAQSSNIGVYDSNDFAIVSELGVTLAYQFNCRLRATVGYTFLYWSQVARPGEQIDTDLNLTQLDPDGLVGAPRPEFRWTMTDVWAQTLNAGLEYRF